MEQQTRGVTPLRRRMIDDMRMRKLEEKTQTIYRESGLVQWPEGRLPAVVP